MSVCKDCGFVGGWHYPWCIHPNPSEPLTAPQPQPTPTHYVERCGGLTVYQPIRPKPRKTP